MGTRIEAYEVDDCKSLCEVQQDFLQQMVQFTHTTGVSKIDGAPQSAMKEDTSTGSKLNDDNTIEPDILLLCR